MRTFNKVMKFRMERWIQRGVFHQLLFVAGLIVLVAVGGGWIAHATTDRFEGNFDAIWWSFLRLTDPGYLGDDEGAVLRTISTVVTVLGYVLFMGSLIAILTQWLSSTLRRLESGLTPITMRGHIVILGWTNRTPEVVLQLLGGKGRLKRFLQERRTRSLRIVVLADHVDAARRQDLRAHVGKYWNENQVLLRSGSSLEIDDLERLDLRRSAAIVVPGADFELGGAELTDARAVKTLLSLGRVLQPVAIEDRPSIVVEIFDPRKVEIAESAVPDHPEVIASDAVISRLISQSVRHRRLAGVFLELLTEPEGNSLYVRGLPELIGEHPIAISKSFAKARVIGAVRQTDDGWITHLNPEPDFRLEEGDLLVFVARRFADCSPSKDKRVHSLPRGPEAPLVRAAEPNRVLILGWSYKAATLLSELCASSSESFHVTVVTRIAVAERQRVLAHIQVDANRVRIEHVQADYAVVGLLEGIGVEKYSSIVFLASSGMENSEQADARTVLGYVLLKALLAKCVDPPQIILELLDPANGRIFAKSDDVMLVSSRILSHLVAHVCLRPELNSVYTALIVAGGAEIMLRSSREVGLEGRKVTFGEIDQAVRDRYEIALGVLTPKGERENRVHLNPLLDSVWQLGPESAIVVLAQTAQGED